MENELPTPSEIRDALTILNEFTNNYGSGALISLSQSIEVANEFASDEIPPSTGGAFATIAKYIEKHGHASFVMISKAISTANSHCPDGNKLITMLRTRALYAVDEDSDDEGGGGYDS